GWPLRGLIHLDQGSRAEARQDVFDYIEMFYNPTRKHTKNGMLSPVDFERQHETVTEGV
ncbi:MAG: IS3 family transposase, partial [Rhodospirillaceae bacterium]|nr:IS3 family transposase [Rhodospirillaceae bacterium]